MSNVSLYYYSDFSMTISAGYIALPVGGNKWLEVSQIDHSLNRFVQNNWFIQQLLSVERARRVDYSLASFWSIFVGSMYLKVSYSIFNFYLLNCSIKAISHS